VVITTLESLGVKSFKILLNDRAVFADIPKEGIAVIDKLKKIGRDGVLSELKEKAIDSDILTKISESNPTQRIQEVKALLDDERVIFEPTLARGLDYYTGIIIEAEIDGYEGGSIGGGGRYNELIGIFNGRSQPAVGFAFGFDRLFSALTSLNLLKISPSVAQVLVTIFSPELKQDAINAAVKLRMRGVNTDLWLEDNSKMEKQVKYALKKQIPYLLIIGPEEKEKNMVTIKALDIRDQKTVTLDEAIQMIG
jgi:histidyl-tRNA synthetase